MEINISDFKHKYKLEIFNKTELIDELIIDDLTSLCLFFQNVKYKIEKINLNQNLIITHISVFPRISSIKLKTINKEEVEKTYSNLYSSISKKIIKEKKRIIYKSFLISSSFFDLLNKQKIRFSIIKIPKLKNNFLCIDKDNIYINCNNHLMIFNLSLYNNNRLVNLIDQYLYGINYNQKLKIINMNQNDTYYDLITNQLGEWIIA